ncbi:MAG: RNA polymerase sigma factor FliA [Succinivibrionaceae bacterium]|nr:RNA polymerase sigma factor FliA [Succinivibrionaceae bacterium]
MNGAKIYSQNRYSSKEDKTRELVTRYAPLVKKIALHLKARLPHSVQVDDLIQSGMIGLLDASNNFDDSKGASFETFASIRIRGAMIDEIRSCDWAPRSVHQSTRRISDAMTELAKKLGRDATDLEVSEYLGIPVDEYHRMLYESSTTKIVGIEDLGVSADALVFENQNINENKPLNAVLEHNYRQSLAKAIETLPPKEALLLSLYYKDELNMKEIGKIMEISESRVSQILNQTILRLRSKLKDWF